MNTRPFSSSRYTYDGDVAILYAAANLPLVACGGKSELSERAFDEGIDQAYRSGLGYDINAAYAIALNGGEPYAMWI